MDNRVLERIVIIILLVLDLFLLGVVLGDRAEARRSRGETEAYLTRVLESNGVSVGKNAVLVQQAPPKCTLVRSAETEKRMAAKLVGGDPGVEDLGGNILFYRARQGQAVFRGSGETEALLSPNAVVSSGKPEKTTARLLRKMGLEAELLASGVNEADGETYTELLCCREGCPVFNAVLHFDFSGDCVYMLTGTRIFDRVTEERSEGLLDSASALLRFVELLRSGEIACTRLERFRPGYLSSVLVSGESTLSPVWCLETDGGTILINAENGKIVSNPA